MGYSYPSAGKTVGFKAAQLVILALRLHLQSQKEGEPVEAGKVGSGWPSRDMEKAGEQSENGHISELSSSPATAPQLSFRNTEAIHYQKTCVSSGFSWLAFLPGGSTRRTLQKRGVGLIQNVLFPTSPSSFGL